MGWSILQRASKFSIASFKLIRVSTFRSDTELSRQLVFDSFTVNIHWIIIFIFLVYKSHPICYSFTIIIIETWFKNDFEITSDRVQPQFLFLHFYDFSSNTHNSCLNVFKSFLPIYFFCHESGYTRSIRVFVLFSTICKIFCEFENFPFL